jgi:hypothetical protein
MNEGVDNLLNKYITLGFMSRRVLLLSTHCTHSLLDANTCPGSVSSGHHVSISSVEYIWHPFLSGCTRSSPSLNVLPGIIQGDLLEQGVRELD